MLALTQKHTQIHSLSLPFEKWLLSLSVGVGSFCSAECFSRKSLNRATEWTERKAVQEKDGMQGGYNVGHFLPSVSVQHTKTFFILYVVLCPPDQFNRKSLST